jgi:short-subunit dehydrogenase
VSSETVLITGASVGIGRELSLLFAADHYDLVLVARDQRRLESVADECRKAGAANVRVLPADLAEAGAADRIAGELSSLGIIVDILVNNAGFGSSGLFWKSDVKQQLDMVQVNISALVHLSRLFLPAMIQRGRGRVMDRSRGSCRDRGWRLILLQRRLCCRFRLR